MRRVLDVVLFAALVVAWEALVRYVMRHLHLEYGVQRQLVETTGLLAISALCTWKLLQERDFGYTFTAGWMRELAAGLAISALMVLGVVAIEAAVGSVTITSRTDAGPAWYGAVRLLLVWFPVAAMAEELMVRGFALRALSLAIHPWLAAAILSVIFGLLHLANAHAGIASTLVTIAAGLWLSAARLRTGRLWLSTGLHWGWNASVAMIGLPLSGMDFHDGAFLAAIDHGPVWLTGGVYGPEAGVAATLVLLAATAWLLRPAPELPAPAAG